MRDDRELLLAWRDGDSDAGRALFERQYEALTRFFLGKVPDDDVTDMVQQTLLAGLKSADRLREAGAFRPYLFRIAHNVLISRWRKRGVGADAEFVSAADAVAIEASPSQKINAVQQDRLLVGALRRLPIDLQLTLELHYWEGLSTGEIGEVFEIPVGTVKSQMRRARLLLRELIHDLATSKEALRTTLDNFDRWSASVGDQLDGERRPPGRG